MKKTRFVFLALMAMAMVMALALAGCGSSGSEGNESSGSEAAGSSISFETEDLDGNPVNSADLFGENKVTMINVWGTTCPPCIEEMPEIEKLSGDYADQGGAVIGIVCDVPAGDDTYVEQAREIVRTTGVTFPNLRAWDGFNETMDLAFTPTTYFVDSSGAILGEPIIGADTDMYRAQMEEYLAREQ